MDHIQNSYDNRGGYRGNLALTVAFAAAAIFDAGGAAFSSGDLRTVLAVLTGLTGFASFISWHFWSEARERYMDETLGIKLSAGWRSREPH